MTKPTETNASVLCRCCGAVLPPATPRTRIDQVPGQEHAKRALEIALAGAFSIAFVGIGAGYPDALALAQAARLHGLTAWCLSPCPCGDLGDDTHPCTCTPAQVGRMRASRRYQTALLADIHIEVPAPPLAIRLGTHRPSEPDEAILGRVAAALQHPRPAVEVRDAASESLMRAAVRQLDLATADIQRLWGLAAVIAQLAGRGTIAAAHLAEAVQYRRRAPILPRPVA